MVRIRQETHLVQGQRRQSVHAHRAISKAALALVRSPTADDDCGGDW